MNIAAENHGIRIKVLRELTGFTQSNIANFLKVDLNFISMVERGDIALTSDMLEKLASLFGVQLSEFYDDELNLNPSMYRLPSCELSEDDLEAISSVNRIALNCCNMTKMIDYGN